MATIIDLPGGGFIAGDPPETLPERHHWCVDCGGSGLGYYYDGEGDLTICFGCYGSCSLVCEDSSCDEHPYQPNYLPTRIYSFDTTMAASLATAAILLGDLRLAREWALEFALHRDSELSSAELLAKISARS